MRFVALLLIATFALSGCMQSEVRVGPEPSHDHCYFFCQDTTHVHYDFFPLTVFLAVLGVVVLGIIIAAASSGRDGGQQQQQQVVIHQRK